MKALTLLHRWTGGLVGLLLTVLALSGTILVWEEYWIGLPGADDPLIVEPRAIAAAVSNAVLLGELSQITFAGEDFGLHLAIYADGRGAYLNQNAEVVARWSDHWGRPELWLFDLHHYLLAGETGETIAGALGLVLAFLVISGAILWWRTRKTFSLRLLPQRMTRSAIIRHHRDLGVVSAPLLLLSAVTGALLVFAPLSQFLLSPWSGTSPVAAVPRISPSPQNKPDWTALVATAVAEFPGAVPRRLQMSPEPEKPYLMRLRQDFEWTPNGRTYVYLDPATGEVIATVDPASGDVAQSIQEKLYPVHAGKTGGALWKLALTFGGLCLFMLGIFATWSFWFPRTGSIPQVSRNRVDERVSA